MSVRHSFRGKLTARLERQQRKHLPVAYREVAGWGVLKKRGEVAWASPKPVARKFILVGKEVRLVGEFSMGRTPKTTPRHLFLAAVQAAEQVNVAKKAARASLKKKRLAEKEEST